MLALIFCSVLFFFAAFVNAQWPSPGPRVGNCNRSHDPSVARRPDGKHFRFASDPNVTVATATALSGPLATQPGGTQPSSTQLGVRAFPNIDLHVHRHPMFIKLKTCITSTIKPQHLGITMRQRFMWPVPYRWSQVHGQITGSCPFPDKISWY